MKLTGKGEKRNNQESLTNESHKKKKPEIRKNVIITLLLWELNEDETNSVPHILFYLLRKLKTGVNKLT